MAQALLDAPSLLSSSEALHRSSHINEAQHEIATTIWQVFFLPKDGPNSIDSPLVAFCPFTHVFAEGNDLRDAACKWIAAAKKKFPGAKASFSIPKYNYISRKVWY